jgi:hypothetical protein
MTRSEKIVPRKPFLHLGRCSAHFGDFGTITEGDSAQNPAYSRDASRQELCKLMTLR